MFLYTDFKMYTTPVTTSVIHVQGQTLLVLYYNYCMYKFDHTPLWVKQNIGQDTVGTRGQIWGLS